MNKVQLVQRLPNSNNAGSKAPSDMCFFAEQKAYKKIFITNHIGNTSLIDKIKILFEYITILFRIKRKSIVLIQYPYISLGRIFKKILNFLYKKNVKIVTLIHDLDELRFEENNNSKESFTYISNISMVLIAHNHKMIDYLIQRGISQNKLVNLEIFDYKTECLSEIKERKFDKSVIIAGNLSISKASYLADLYKLSKIKFSLYGVNYDKNSFKGENFVYKGVFSPDELPNKLEGGFGLVWDGNTIDTCSGLSGEYLKFNNPHKLSLYLASGIPVFIWKKAAEADFVERNSLGFTINSLEDIENIFKNITSDKYFELCQNVKNISKKITNGNYIQKALDISEKIILEKNV